MNMAMMNSGSVSFLAAILPLVLAAWLLYTAKRHNPLAISWEGLDLSHDSQVVLEALLKKEAAYSKAKARRDAAVFALAATAAIFLFTFYSLVLLPAHGYMLALMTGMADNQLVTLFLLLTISTLVYSNHAKKNMDKEKAEYKALRLEVIDKFNSSWAACYEASVRDEISKRLYEQAKINIRYKND